MKHGPEAVGGQSPRFRRHALDSAGNVCLTGKGGTVFDRAGKKIDEIAVPEPWTANVCFGGKDRKTLFITASTGLYGIKMRAVGQAITTAIACGLLVREDLFLQTKFTFSSGQAHRLPYDLKASIRTQINQSLGVVPAKANTR